jgi:hypothetical protein
MDNGSCLVLFEDAAGGEFVEKVAPRHEFQLLKQGGREGRREGGR